MRLDIFTELKTKNHGIREKNVLSILLPIGVRHDKLDRLFLSEIDNYGKLRGEYAHSGVSAHVRKRPNPKDELVKVNKIVDMIKPIDDELNMLLAQVS